VTFELTPTGPKGPAPSAEPGKAAPTLFERLGGHDAVVRLVDAFYDRIEGDDELRAIFPQDLSAGREKQMLFMEQWLGGEPIYSQRYGHSRLRRRHFPFVVSERGAGRWLRHMTEALRECGAADDVVAEMLAALGPLAHQMVNEGQAVPREPLEDSFLS
jgi:hemoglobin